MPHSIETQVNPLIGYAPDYKLYLARSAKLAAFGKNSVPALPHGFPQKVSSAMVWDSNSFTKDEWFIQLDNNQLEEIDNAVRFFEGLKIPMGFLSPETFPLPSLGPFIRDVVAKDIYHGKGFAVLRGIPVAMYNDVQNIIIHTGLASWLGRLRGRQEKDGNIVLRHIKDMTKEDSEIQIGTAQYTADAQAFHTDFGDVVSLYCVGTPAEGGSSHLASLGRIYNELAATRPDVLGVLAGDWPFATFEGDQEYTLKPVLFYCDGRLILQYSRRLFTGYQAFRNTSDKLNVTYADAMDSLEFLAREFSVSMTLQKGDVQWTNNLGVLHSRDQFRDDEHNVREMHRLWIRSEEQAWELPKQLQQQWREIYHSVQPGKQDFFPFESRWKLSKTQALNRKTDLVGSEWAGKPLLGKEWAGSRNKDLVGTEWAGPKNLLGTEWTGTGEKKLPGEKCSAKNFFGGEWAASKNQLLGGEWAGSNAQLLGAEWAGPSKNLLGAGSMVLLGGEWAGSRSEKNLLGAEWAGALHGNQTGLLGGGWARSF